MNNNLILVLLGILGSGGYYLYQRFIQANVAATLQQTKDEDLDLVKQQQIAQSKLDQVNKDIADLKVQRAQVQNDALSDQQKADTWNTPPKP